MIKELRSDETFELFVLQDWYACLFVRCQLSLLP
jgi:hypothetical protein